MSYVDFPFYKGERSYVCAPPWVIYGLVNSIYSGLIFSTETQYSMLPNEPMLYNALGGYDYVFGVPVYYRYLYDTMIKLKNSNEELDKCEYQRICDELKRVKLFISGGDKLSEEETLRWQCEFNVPVVNGYGNNEIVGAGICSPRFANKPGSIGIPLYGNTVKTFDPSTNAMLEDGEVGEIAVSNDSMFVEYLNNPDETNNVKKYHDGAYWVHTGDLGYIDKDGYVYITGRSKRLIINKLGYKLSPDHIENVISSVEEVKECVVVGGDVNGVYKIPIAFIEFNGDVLNKEETLNKIKNLCVSKLKDYEIPEYYEEVKIPHKSNGGKRDFLLLEEKASEVLEREKGIQRVRK